MDGTVVLPRHFALAGPGSRAVQLSNSLAHFLLLRNKATPPSASSDSVAGSGMSETLSTKAYMLDRVAVCTVRYDALTGATNV